MLTKLAVLILMIGLGIVYLDFAYNSLGWMETTWQFYVVYLPSVFVAARCFRKLSDFLSS